MYISPRLSERIGKRYLWGAGFCLLFAVVYELFSHGVWSLHMMSMPIYPLLSAGVIHMIAMFRKLYIDWFYTFWLCGTITLTAGACLTGIFEIYGTDFPFHWLLIVLGIGLLILAVVICNVKKWENPY